MPDMTEKNAPREITIRHRGRGAQVFIYLGKLLRMFIYQNDWKVLPMAALIAGLVGMVIRRKCFVQMEGTLMGAFAIVCVCIWNGCFNSIQVICRERDVIKREHRSGMHISSYICSHMIYQFLLCMGQTAVTLYVTRMVGVQYPAEGTITNPFYIEFGISMFLITYASDMLSLWVSSLAHTTTAAMTIMPFVLIFQLVFSGGMMTLPAWTKNMTHFTISNPGLKVIAAQADVNHKPYATISNMVTKMRDNEIGGTVSVGQVLDLLENKDNQALQDLRAREIGKVFTLGELADYVKNSATFEDFRKEHVLENTSWGDILRSLLTSEDMQKDLDASIGGSTLTLRALIQAVLDSERLQGALNHPVFKETTVNDLLSLLKVDTLIQKYSDLEIDARFTVGKVLDLLTSNPDIQAKRDTTFTVKTTLGRLLDLVGEDRVKTFLEEKAAAASYNADYENNAENIVGYWLSLAGFVFLFALLAMVTLEFIDKDKR